MNFLQVLFTVFIIKQCLCDENVEVNLKQGVLIGKIERTLYKKQDYFSFRGVPFAETPTGELRFQPPKPLQSWDGKLEAFENKPTCMQFNTRGRLREPAGMSGSEDCLFINVFTPSIEGTAPVIVFDFNDNFKTGFNGTDTYSPDFFIEEGVIVVTIANRLGIFGYLTTEDHVIPGNNGLKDYILGLEWIKNNIERFGGDPSRVTLMGSRGGAAIADVLLYSEKAKGLFSGAILQSGTAMESMYFFDNPRTKAFEVGEFLNLTVSNSDELLQELRNVDAEKLLDAEISILVNLDNKGQTTRIPFAPNLDDEVITELPEIGKIVNDVPVIIGFNSREGLDLISHYIIEPRLLTTDAEETILQLPIRTDFRFEHKSPKYKEANSAILKFYLKDGSLHYGNLLEHAVYVADHLQNYALNLAAEHLSKRLSSSVFYYIFDFRGLWNENSEVLATRSRFPVGNHGASVLDELCYLFVCSRLKKTYEQLLNLPSEQPELKVLKKLVRLWSNFAKTGNPTPNKDDQVLKKISWEPFSNETDFKYLHITKVLKMKSNPLGERRKFWQDFLEKYSQEAIDGVVKGEESHDEL
ncbi:venom carboxylesterase-6-like [Anticarsia gemmatalis]|uniref:venom carboxylesterase-6-like n=1 Tax=Anticarsia gemmatalis TaxID=129554 RepID=UPI003F75BD36